MLANYHTHSYHCRHADGRPADYAEAAVQGGLQILGFSDHVPYPFGNGHVSGFRMPTEETEQYVREIGEVRAQYAGRLTVYTGYEAEYYPAHFTDMLRHIEQFGYDYLILGQHFLQNEYDGEPSMAVHDERGLKAYVDQTVEAMQTGAFLYMAHPDMVGYRADEAVFSREMRRLCAAARECDMPLEFNLLGFREKRIYPYAPFWRLAAEEGCRVVLGCDAHTPRYTGDPETVQAALAALSQLGIVPVELPGIKK